MVGVSQLDIGVSAITVSPIVTVISVNIYSSVPLDARILMSTPSPARSGMVAVMRVLVSVTTMLSSNSAVSKSNDRSPLLPSRDMIVAMASIALSVVILPLISSCCKYTTLSLYIISIFSNDNPAISRLDTVAYSARLSRSSIFILAEIYPLVTLLPSTVAI